MGNSKNMIILSAPSINNKYYKDCFNDIIDFLVELAK